MTRTRANDVFSWLHVSDIHCGHGDRKYDSDQTRMLMWLRQDARRLVNEGLVPRPMAILVTGDIAFSGGVLNRHKYPEYERAGKFLKALCKDLDVNPREVYLVPGNHDVCRDKPGTMKFYKLNDLRARAQPPTTRDAHKLAARFKGYTDFVKAYGFHQECAKLNWSAFPAARENLGIRLIGWNSAYLSNDDSDCGKLALDEGAVNRTVANHPRAGTAPELNILLTHHPLAENWLRHEGDLRRTIVRGHVDIHLSGHVHEHKTLSTRSGSGDAFVHISAGAVHGESPREIHLEKEQMTITVPSTHGYSFGSIRRESPASEQLELHVYPRRWYSSAGFRWEVEHTPHDMTHATHRLSRVTLPLDKGAYADPQSGVLGSMPCKWLPHFHTVQWGAVLDAASSIDLVANYGDSWVQEYNKCFRGFFSRSGVMRLALPDVRNQLVMAAVSLKYPDIPFQSLLNRIEQTETRLVRLAESSRGKLKVTHLTVAPHYWALRVDENVTYVSPYQHARDERVEAPVWIVDPADNGKSHTTWQREFQRLFQTEGRHSAESGSGRGWITWITGRPGVGKTTVAKALSERATDRTRFVCLDSDWLRESLTLNPDYSDHERDRLYSNLVAIADLLSIQGYNVIISATGHRRVYREWARRCSQGRYIEILLDGTEELCRARKPSLYASGTIRASRDYERSTHHDVVTIKARENEKEVIRRVQMAVEKRIGSRGAFSAPPQTMKASQSRARRRRGAS